MWAWAMSTSYPDVPLYMWGRWPEASPCAVAAVLQVEPGPLIM